VAVLVFIQSDSSQFLLLLPGGVSFNSAVSRQLVGSAAMTKKIALASKLLADTLYGVPNFEVEI
jgi:hypothetical protein